MLGATVWLPGCYPLSDRLTFLPSMHRYALRQVSGSTSEDPAEPIAIPEAGVDPLSSRLQQIWEEQWKIFATSAKENIRVRVYLTLTLTLNPPQDNQRSPK